MASSDEKPGLMPGADDGTTPGKALTMGHQIMDKGSKLMQSLKPINKISEHVSTFSVYSQNMSRQIETHHFISRLNQDFCQCAVYDSHLPNARLIGIEYIISEKIFESLPPEEQKLWHSHAYEIKAGLWVNPGVPGMIQNPELQTFAKTYGKFWCTWQVDRGNIFLSADLLTVFLRDVSQAQSIKGDKLPLVAPTLMMSPQSENRICTELIKKREEKYQVLNESLISSRSNIEEPQPLISYADHWRQSGKGFAIDIQKTDMKLLNKQTLSTCLYYRRLSKAQSISPF